jgi:hypothetical protein
MTLVVDQGQFMFAVVDTAIIITLIAELVLIHVAYKSGGSLYMNGFVEMVQMNTGMYLAYIDDILRGFVLLSEGEIAFNMAGELLNIENQVLTTPLGSISPNSILVM